MRPENLPRGPRGRGRAPTYRGRRPTRGHAPSPGSSPSRFGQTTFPSRGRPSPRANARMIGINESKRGGFVKIPKMGTLRAQADSSRQHDESQMSNEFLGSPPTTVDLIQAYIILPANDPNYKDIQHVFDSVRRQQCVWVEVQNNGILLLSSRTTIALQNGVKSINTILSTTRMAKSEGTARCHWLQEQVLDSAAIPIRIIVGQRLHLLEAATNFVSDRYCITQNIQKIQDKLGPSFASIETLNGQVALSTSYGTMLLKGKSFQIQSELVFETIKLAMKHDMLTFADHISPIDEEICTPSALVRFVTDPATTICDNLDAVTWSHQVSYRLHDVSLTASAYTVADGALCFSTGRWVSVDETCHFDWKFVAPELSIDWALQLSSQRSHDPGPREVESLLRSLQWTSDHDGGPHTIFGCLPVCIAISKPALQTLKTVNEVEMITSCVIPIAGTRFMLEIQLTRIWNGVLLSQPPKGIWMNVRVYAGHWEEALNHIPPGQSCRKFDNDLKEVWPGSGTLHSRLFEFVGCVVRVQKKLSCFVNQCTENSAS
ncbi:hypothetical protein VHEMI08966 [[Torrubiella] hemipterigena]|uniref:Uncharacterized protein n=1 Tax=[Torrubiella] hemipterigena TaxID=1531966 RepID=A0A0A1TF38_9HYPO|nr:hypothetical protein VHEMI08966 [[Torrubiella] hemipterigena]